MHDKLAIDRTQAKHSNEVSQRVQSWLGPDLLLLSLAGSSCSIGFRLLLFLQSGLYEAIELPHEVTFLEKAAQSREIESIYI